MLIDNKPHTQPVERSTGPQRAEKPESSETDRTESRAVDSLRRALDALPEVRADVVQRGRELVGDPAYPSRETMRGLAHLLALGLKENE